MYETQLYDKQGNRLYLTTEERQMFLKAASQAPKPITALCSTLAYSGCRLSEALELTPRRVALTEQCLRIRSLKKRKDKDGNPRIVYRSIPMPPTYIDQLDQIYGIRGIQRLHAIESLDQRLWPWKRCWAWHLVKRMMNAAGIPNGPHKTAKGLRHAFGIGAMKAGIQLNMLQKWMGHADMKTTAVYANALGDEERAIAARMWMN